MGATDTPNTRLTQKLNHCVSVAVSASATSAVFTFPSPAPGYVWTGTINCAGAPYNAIFTATIGNVSWGNWAGNSVYGPVQAEGGEQLVITMTLTAALATAQTFEMCWLGSVDESGMVAPIWPDANSSSQQTQLVGAISANITGGSLSSVGTITNPVGVSGGSLSSVGSITNPIGISGSVATTSGATTINGAGFTGASTSVTVAATSSFPASGLISVPGSGGTLIFAYTGTTSTTFTGLTLIAGVSSWTIANGAPVISASSSTGQVVNNPNAPSIDQILTSSGGAFSSLNTVLVNSSLNQSYSSFMLIMGTVSASLLNVGFTVTLSNGTTGESWTLSQYITSSTDAPEFHFPIAVSSSQTLSVVVNCSGLPNATTINGAGFTGASTSVTVASTTGFPTSGFISIPTLGANGNILTFAYTNTTATTFTGLTLFSGNSAWTIPNGAAVKQSLATSWQVVGYRDQHRIALANNALDVLHMNQYGGVQNLNVQNITAGSNSTGPTAPAGYLLRLHFWGVYQPTSAAITGAAVLVGSVIGAIYGTIPMSYATAGTNAGSQILDGLLVSGFTFYNSTNKTLNFSANYDIVQAPQIL